MQDVHKNKIAEVHGAENDVFKGIEHFGFPEHCECPAPLPEGLLEHDQVPGLPEWMEVMPGLFYRGQWIQTGQEPPVAPMGKGWVIHKEGNCGIAAAWVNAGKPMGIFNVINCQGQKCLTPFDENGVKEGVETVMNQDGSQFEQTYSKGLLPNGQPF